MDYDSSTKFISSLAKFLQSLCNGYVEFDNGVQVIGHLYLNVDTGKTIDYVLNEKVCKTDENSVTFISNSFHAQPAEKPKPPGKKSERETEKGDLKSEGLENGNQMEPKSTNVGTVPSSQNYSSSMQTGAKRPLSPSHSFKKSKPGHMSPKHKRSRIDTDQPSSDGTNLSSPADPSQFQSSSHETPSFSDSYQQNIFTGDDNSLGEGQEHRDIKPSFDTDVTFIKEEYAPSSGIQGDNQDDGSHDDNTAAYSSSFQDQQFHSGPYANPSGFTSNQRSFNSSGDHSMFGSQMEGDGMSNDPAEPLNLNVGGSRGNAESLGASALSSCADLVASVNTNSADGALTSPSPLHWPQRRLSYPPRSGFDSFNHRSPTEALALSPFSSSSPINPQQAQSQWRMSRDMYGNPLFSTCLKCGGKYTNPNTCASHEAKCNGVNRLMCHLCKRVYSQMCALKEHLRGKHGLGEMLKCKLCDRSFKYKPQLYDHACVGLKDSQSASPGAQSYRKPITAVAVNEYGFEVKEERSHT